MMLGPVIGLIPKQIEADLIDRVIGAMKWAQTQ